jgi:D-sedoheptulose 7-phosphate isomerase
VDLLAERPVAGRAVLWVGNGGSAAIASHICVDFFKAGARSLSFNDGPMLTCMANDYGYDQVFSRPIEFCAGAGDVLVAISSSGRSLNILNAVAAARSRGGEVLTLSGFDAGNPLRALGDWNFYVGSGVYGYVETVHAAICHALYDAWAEKVHGRSLPH